jgi:structural maintenance of chromosome 3 (chondroitin sulfate proteoglycan 6)
MFSNLQEKSLDNIRNQIEQVQSSIAMKNDEMGTELIDQLTSEERDLLSRLNPEITDLKERFLMCKNSRIEVIQKKSVAAVVFCSQEIFICSNAVQIVM